ncbi:TolC family protein [Sphingomonas azotifigens]|uniref:TolC family protein n=1 Tax=Sphingomonas azotifigens TaxID=330920 RepID=UPI000A026A0F|nr:TolC family protein [Sphingomonas azotifigens]
MHRHSSLDPAAYRPAHAWLAAVSALTLGGCATSSERLAPTSYDRPWTPATSASGEMVAGQAADAPASAGSFVLPENPALAALPAAPETDPQHLYNLAELLDLAHSANPRARIAWYEARNAALTTGIVRSSTGPKLSATGVGRLHTSDSTVSGLGLTGGGDSSSTGGVVALSLEWLLFDFGARDALVQASRQQTIVANIAFTAEHQRVTHEVALAFYDDGAARARSRTADQAVEIAAAVQAAAEARRERGVGTVMEVAQTRQATAQLRFAAVQAHAAAEDARLHLLTAIGLSPLTHLQVADSSDRALPTGLADRAEQAVGKALSRRPDMLAALANRKASEAGVRAARADFLPKVFASGTAAYSGGNHDLTSLPGLGAEPTLNLSDHRTSGSLMLGVRVPLFDGGTRAARLAQARNRVEMANASLEATRSSAVLQIVTAENALRSALEANAAAGEAYAAARTSFDAAFAAYRSGVGAITDVNLARQQLLSAENAVTDAKAAALRNAATLALATGSLDGAPE